VANDLDGWKRDAQGSDPLWIGYSIGHWDGNDLWQIPRISTIKPGSTGAAIRTARR